jgi:hypothetical protein
MRIINDLPPTEIAIFYSVLRLYFTNAKIKEINLKKLSDVNQPVKTIKA